MQLPKEAGGGGEDTSINKDCLDSAFSDHPFPNHLHISYPTPLLRSQKRLFRYWPWSHLIPPAFLIFLSRLHPEVRHQTLLIQSHGRRRFTSPRVFVCLLRLFSPAFDSMPNLALWKRWDGTMASPASPSPFTSLFPFYDGFGANSGVVVTCILGLVINSIRDLSTPAELTRFCSSLLELALSAWLSEVRTGTFLIWRHRAKYQSSRGRRRLWLPPMGHHHCAFYKRTTPGIYTKLIS